jgi:hypothetical protein
MICVRQHIFGIEQCKTFRIISPGLDINHNNEHCYSLSKLRFLFDESDQNFNLDSMFLRIILIYDEQQKRKI